MAAPVNDLPAGAIALPAPAAGAHTAPVAATTVEATYDNGGGLELTGGNTYENVWFTLTPTVTGRHMLRLKAAAAANYAVTVRNGAGNGAGVAGFSGWNGTDVLVFLANLTAGVTYYISIGTLEPTAFTIELGAIPVNNRLSAATEMIGDDVTVPWSTIGADKQVGEWYWWGSTVWFAWTPATSGVARVSMTVDPEVADANDFDVSLGVWSDRATEPDGNQHPIAWTGSGEGWADVLPSVALDVVADTTYYIAVDTEDDDWFTGTLSAKVLSDAGGGGAPEPVYDGGLSVFQIEEWFDLLQAKDVWFALFFDDPLQVADPLAVELGGPSYNRPKVVWGRPGPQLLRNGNALAFTGLTPGSPIAAIGGFDAAVNGNLLFAAPESELTVVPAGGLITLPALSYFVGLDT